ncbi:MAG: hypothetical protein HN704_13580 [Bacteroidetes bacterium]|jgi:hypothetical protein|nr:hypothetical protein [Bacteroidota bacterium]MBT6687054.1 hypothetical protein [Bacteroidota bacterium]MBT7142843.1 hypothetical protein [Bacteroidota bacterium]MBT7492627.1 hypothetical protein [Bacteroidota bacterium]
MTELEEAKLKDLILENLPEKEEIEASKLSEQLNENVQKIRSVLEVLEVDNKIIVRRADFKGGSERHIRKHPDFFFEKEFYLEKFLKEEDPDKSEQIVNLGNIVMGDNSGTLSQSSDNFSKSRTFDISSNSTSSKKRTMSRIKLIALILSIIVSIIFIYQFFNG